jgi:DNA-binding LytR/AlgR family response regulator
MKPVRILSIDDEDAFLRILSDLIDRYELEHAVTLIHEEYTHLPARHLLEWADLIILDIRMPVNGFELSKQISYFSSAEIVFVSSQNEFVFHSFPFKPYCFLRKDHLEEDFSNLMNLFVQDHCHDFQININQTLITLPAAEISVIRVQRNYVHFTAVKHEYRIKKSLTALVNENEWLFNVFIQVNRSELVNPAYIKSVKRDRILLKSGSVLYLTQKYYTDFLKRYYTLR